MSTKKNWAEVDKRIRDRRPVWTQQERDELAKGLEKLPDLAEEVEYIDIPQPALAQPEEEEAEGDDAKAEEAGGEG